MRNLSVVERGVRLFVIATAVLVAVSAWTARAADVSRSEPAQCVFGAGSVALAQWPDGKESAFSLYSDDGYFRSIKSTWTPEKPDVPYDGFYRLGKTYDIPFTFFICPGFVTGWKHPTAWPDWKFMQAQGHSIGSHSQTHQDFRPDSTRLTPDRSAHLPVSKEDPRFQYGQPITDIEKHIGVKPVVVQFPYGRAVEEVVELCRALYPLVNADHSKDDEVLSGHYGHETAAADLAGLLGQAVSQGKWLMVGGHGIQTKLGASEKAAGSEGWDGWSPVKYEVLDSFFQQLSSKRDEVFVGTVDDVGLYLKQRRGTTVTVVSQEPASAVLRLSHSLDRRVFCKPMTLVLSLTNAAATPVVTQGGKRLPVMRANSRYLFDAVPNGGDISIRYL